MATVVRMNIRPLDRFQLTVLLADGSSCADCARAIDRFEIISMRRPVGEKHIAFPTCRTCAEKRLRAMVEIIKEDVAASFQAAKSDPR